MCSQCTVIILTMQWFTEPGLDCSEEDFMLFKYRGDFLYFQRQYSEAVDCYKAALRSVPSGKSVVVREFTESIARCRLHLKQPREGLEKALKLVCLCECVCTYLNVVSMCVDRPGTATS